MASYYLSTRLVKVRVMKLGVCQYVLFDLIMYVLFDEDEILQKKGIHREEKISSHLISEYNSLKT